MIYENQTLFTDNIFRQIYNIEVIIRANALRCSSDLHPSQVIIDKSVFVFLAMHLFEKSHLFFLKIGHSVHL